MPLRLRSINPRPGPRPTHQGTTKQSIPLNFYLTQLIKTMDWPLKDAEFPQEDLDTVYRYRSRPNRAVYRCPDDEELAESSLETEEHLTAWVEETTGRIPEGPGLAVLLASRADEGQGHNGAILEYLPFTKTGFERLIAALPLHGDTTRIINRSDIPFYTDINLLDCPRGAIYYCCRTPSTWPGDLAVSAVFYPDTGFTAAVVFGCSHDIAEEIAGRIDNAEDSWNHPLLIMGIIAEIEKERHFELVKKRVFRLLQRVRAVSNSARISSTSEMTKENYSVDLWIEVSQLRSALEAWKAQLIKMLEHIGELERELWVVSENRLADSTSTLTPNLRQLIAKETGRRMQRRLKEILCEYDQKIRECTMVIDGMALSTQLSWSQIGYQDTQANLKIAIDSKKIASDSKQDSSQMRSIAFLTMFFLPATFISSFFSTTFFNWNASDTEEIVSPYLWVYPVVTITITLVVVGCWLVFTRRRPPRDPVLDEKDIV
ncbi:hypothetical protein B0H67DRAFT_569202 [Lasiosphaeris hirsuta]|uniref:Uncharacterized protein n=1 Tax=Lasiosphaeris hirsuta TaxID=260670 RepID=A0AA40AZR6_9PEZI|nr:hypothetical protein B0H67DRAFT_569202 [Lasiosphaeris hirsuta]